MIAENIEKGNLLFPEYPSFQKGIEFIKKAIREELPDGKYEIQGDDIFAKIMSYPLKEKDVTRYEAHEKYIDIQASLIGAEGMDFFYLTDQKPLSEYNEEKDVTFYSNEESHTGHVDVYPGCFAVFFPHDVHKPQLKVGDIDNVKKIVIKIKSSLLNF